MTKKLLLAFFFCCLCSAGWTQEKSGTLEKVAETKTFTIGHRESAVPLSYYDDQQKPIGFAVDLCVKVAEAVKKELKLPDLQVKFAPVSASTRIPLIANGTVDIECGVTTNNLARQQQVSFSTTTFVAANRFASKRADKFAKVTELKGRTITSTAGSNNIQQITAMNASASMGMTILPAKDHAEGFLMLDSGRASAFVMDDILLAGLVANSKDPAKYEISADALSAEPYALMMRRDDPKFKKVVDDTLRQLYASGEIRKIYARWFESPIPPRNVNLSLPPSSALLRVWKTPSDSPDQAAYLD
jgi:glutamate/aspartate transport system substrate-binding protein